MDSSSINPAKGPDIQAKPPASSGKPVAKPPETEVKAAPKDTVSLSPAAKNALESGPPEVTQEAAQETSRPRATSENTARQAERPQTESADLGTDKSRQLSVTEGNDVVLKIIDNKTREVVKQIPSEEELDLRNAIRDGVEKISNENNPTDELI